MSPSPTSPASRRATDDAAARDGLRSALLPGTVANALRTPFYRQHWAGVDASSVELSSLATLPLVDKAAVRAAGRSAQVRDSLVCDEVFTSGTTGVPLVTVRGHREQRVIHEVFGDANRHLHDGPVLRGLQIANPYHGHHVAVPSPIHFHRIGIYDSGSFEHGRGVLTGDHDDAGVERRCSVLLGLERCLRAFTFEARRRHPSGLATALHAVVSYSQYLTSAWRTRLEETWACPVVDRFSVAEVFGGASQCVACRWWHADPYVVAEVVGSRSREPVDEGLGLLALTALYPFQEAQPMVRYLTGDLVEATKSAACHLGTLSFRPLGRACYGVPAPDGDAWLVTPASVLEAVDEVADVARVPRFRDAEQVSDPEAIGHPRYQLEWQARGGRVHVVLALDVPDEAAARFDTTASAVAAAMCAANPSLVAAMDDGTARLRVVRRPGLRPDLVAHAE